MNDLDLLIHTGKGFDTSRCAYCFCPRVGAFCADCGRRAFPWGAVRVDDFMLMSNSVSCFAPDPTWHMTEAFFYSVPVRLSNAGNYGMSCYGPDMNLDPGLYFGYRVRTHRFPPPWMTRAPCCLVSPARPTLWLGSNRAAVAAAG